MDDDLDYYLAMEEDAQQEQEEWDEDVSMDVQQPAVNVAASVPSQVQSNFQEHRPAAPVVALPARTTLPVTTASAKPVIQAAK